MLDTDLSQLAVEALQSLELEDSGELAYQFSHLQASSKSKGLQFERLSGGDCSEVYLLRLPDSCRPKASGLGASFATNRFCLKALHKSHNSNDSNQLSQLHTEMLSLLALRAHFASLEQRVVPIVPITPRVYCVRENANLQVMLLEYLEKQGPGHNGLRYEQQLNFLGMSGLGRLLNKLHRSNSASGSKVLPEEKALFLAALKDSRSGSDKQSSVSESQLFDEFRSGGRLGFYCDNFIGLTPQKNTGSRIYAPSEWSEFFAELRLLPMMERCRQKGLLQKKDVRAIEALCVQLPNILPRLERASLLHGDLWSGNVYWCAAEPVLIDPASYYGHYEVDLAMTRLFSGFGAEFYDSYYAESDLPEPNKAELAERFSIYNLYHLLNHVLLFGSSYYSGVWNTIKAYEPKGQL